MQWLYLMGELKLRVRTSEIKMQGKICDTYDYQGRGWEWNVTCQEWMKLSRSHYGQLEKLVKMAVAKGRDNLR